MDDFDETELERESANSEIRYLTLELMKIAAKRNMSFKEIAKEFISNVYYMKGLISEIEKETLKEKDKHERERKKSNRPY